MKRYLCLAGILLLPFTYFYLSAESPKTTSGVIEEVFHLFNVYLEKEGIIEGVVIKIRFLEVRFN